MTTSTERTRNGVFSFLHAPIRVSAQGSIDVGTRGAPEMLCHRLVEVLAQVRYRESKVYRRGRVVTFPAQRFGIRLQDRLADVLVVDTHQIGVILEHPQLEAELVGGLELDMMEGTVFVTLPPKRSRWMMPSPPRRNGDFNGAS